MNVHAKWLREMAQRLRGEKRYDFANTAEHAASEIDNLQAHRDHLLAAHESRTGNTSEKL